MEIKEGMTTAVLKFSLMQMVESISIALLRIQPSEGGILTEGGISQTKAITAMPVCRITPILEHRHPSKSKECKFQFQQTMCLKLCRGNAIFPISEDASMEVLHPGFCASDLQGKPTQ